MIGGEVSQPTHFTGDIDIDQINAEIAALQDNEDLSDIEAYAQSLMDREDEDVSDIEADFQSMLSEEQESTGNSNTTCYYT